MYLKNKLACTRRIMRYAMSKKTLPKVYSQALWRCLGKMFISRACHNL
ncbi:hypothetical protein HMPREF3190_01530 [Umbribacter vaginalis]|nr:hypothetical protein HMPREF3190_01530 [Coriobacteriales bacterium DNF00809]